MNSGSILTVNGGSSSLKCALFASAKVPQLIRVFNLAGGNHAGNLRQVFDEIDSQREVRPIAAIGHRVVHGGDLYTDPTVIDAEVLASLHKLASLAPLHQPVSLELIEACMGELPGIPQVACFDTAFHSNMPMEARSYALPRALTDAGIRSYGFHGLSYEYILARLQEMRGDTDQLRIIVAHLGAGASLCAIRDGQSVATTMGFSAADGLPMMTRTGSIDPGVLIFLMREHGLGADEIEDLVYRQGGLQGMSGIQGGMQELQSSDDPRARAAIRFFVYRIAREIGSLTAALGGLDLLVFTGGVGANDESIRNAVSDQLTWLEKSPEIFVIPANEELMIATHTFRVQNDQGA